MRSGTDVMRPVDLRLTCKSAYEAFAQSEAVQLQAAMDKQVAVIANMKEEIIMLRAECKFLEGTCTILGTYLLDNLL